MTTLAPIDAGPYPCAHCGTPVRMVGNPRNNEWYWADEAGSVTGSNFPVEPYARLNELAAEMDRLHKVKPAKRTEVDEAALLRMHSEYVYIKMRIDLGATFHTHRVSCDYDAKWQCVSPHHAHPADLPNVEHCDYPAYRGPNGWSCRRCRSALGDDVVVGYPTSATVEVVG